MLNETPKIKSYKYHSSLLLPRNLSFLNNNRLSLSNNSLRKRNTSIQLDSKIKFSFNDNNTMNKTVKEIKSFPTNLKKFPKLISRQEQRLNIYQRMKKYRIKLVKASKTKEKTDNVYQLFKDNGLQFLYPPEKKDIINKENKRLSYLKKNFKRKRLKISLSTQNLNLKDLQYKLVSPKSISNNLKVYQKKEEIYDDEEEEIYKPSFKTYMKLQSLADLKFRPILGESSLDLVNFLKKIELIRKEVINNYIDDINNVENRFNIERPKEDFKFKTKMQGLYPHKWKNIFSLRDYQHLFVNNLKGKISSKNYDIMEKNFRNIFLMCFSSGGYK